MAIENLDDLFLVTIEIFKENHLFFVLSSGDNYKLQAASTHNEKSTKQPNIKIKFRIQSYTQMVTSNVFD